MRTLATALNMTGIEGRVELQLDNSHPVNEVTGGRPQEDVSAAERPSESGEGESNSGQSGLDDNEPLSLLTDVALAPSCGDPAACSCDSEACSAVELRHLEMRFQSMQLEVLFLLSRADDLMNWQDQPEREANAAAVRHFLFTCQPCFNNLESTAQSIIMSHHSSLPLYTGLLDFSQQLCDKLEQLGLTFDRHNLLCLDESDPNSISHFGIGQSQLGQLRLTAFLYFRLTPYLARVDIGLYKRMRWNVETLQDRQQWVDEEQEETIGDTEYYFLCYEKVRGVWSIGQWEQVIPEPDTEDLGDWIACEAPLATYNRLSFLGSEEPSSCSATRLLQQLLSQHTTQ